MSSQQPGGEAAAALRGAQWITAPCPVPPPGQRPAYEFRTIFDAGVAPVRGRLAVTAHGIYEAFLNGERVGDHELSPGATSYRKTLHVQSFEVAGLLRPGSNELRLVVSDGWFRGKCGPRRIPDNFGTELAVVARLEVTDSAGRTCAAVTDPSWDVASGAIVAADLMDGQTTDFRRLGQEQWTAAVPATDPLVSDPGRLEWSPAPPVRATREFAAKSIRRLPSGRQVVDFGQNLNGRVRLLRLGEKGTRVELTHGEALDADGDLTLANLDYFQGPGKPVIGVGQRDVVVSRGNPADAFEPRHTTHGFQYVAVDGLAEDLTLGDVVAVELRTDMEPIGTFECGDADINALHRIVVESWRANTCELPTDCPQRERWGYTGDIQIFARSATFLEDVCGFLTKWLRSLADDQLPDGLITNVAPMCGVPPVDPSRPISFDGAAGWGDAATIVPWELYRAYGDASVLGEFHPMMTRWVDRVARVAETQRHRSRMEARPEPAAHERFLWDSGWQWGEWLEPDVAFDYASDKAIIATGYYAHSARIVSRSASLLGRAEEAQRYRRLADGATDAWRTEFLLPDGSITQPTQANYVRALAFGLIPPALEAATAAHLVALIEGNADRLSTGFLSTGMLLPVLAEHGHADVAFRLLFQAEEPGWLVMLDRGATTVWESWAGIASDGTARDSLNHYSKGAVITFLHEYVAGIRPAAPGYTEIEIRPHPHPRLGWAEGRLRTPGGMVTSRWELDGEEFTLQVEVPRPASAVVHLPDGASAVVGAGRHSFTVRLRSEAGAA